MILVDTSVWIEHLRRRQSRLASELEADQMMTHPFVIGELACGNLRNRSEILALLHELPHAPSASDDEVLAFIESRKLNGTGLGYIDAHLLASAVLSQTARIWTRDMRLASAASKLKVRFDPTQ